MDDFSNQIYSQVHQIPFGRVSTYGDIAKFAGYPGYARHVGRLMATLPEGSTIPWHRVINSQGRISLTDDALLRQIAALRAEDIEVSDNGRLVLRYYRWQGHS
ncbi:MGMT family protein [Photobacterium andalusiense]|uniref:Methylated-DNA--protein-cysteine methyltransferase n=1 Tax=Photobacterium andalusiense TaxID=2204296 RepID=A0A1Y6M9L2_9GAMM|nr:MGMT family protein [Photobacterium andalusiense]SMY31941.1 Methylated-DNA--protein-cysteine methyltransferase [Photobacterium andalusiense]